MGNGRAETACAVRAVTIAAAALFWAAVPVAAERAPLAVGQLELRGWPICVATLVAPDLVLTAAHCLFSPGTHQALALGDLRFRVGGFSARAYRGVVDSRIAEGFQPDAPVSPDRMRRDLALLRLDYPLAASTVVPLPMAADAARTAGAALPPPQSPLRTCAMQPIGPGLRELACGAGAGGSGSPLLVRDASGGLAVAGLVVAAGNADGDTVRAFAVMMPAGRVSPP